VKIGLEFMTLNHCWLAVLSSARLEGLAVVNMLAALLQSPPGETAKQEARKGLGLIADTDDDERVRQAAQVLTK